MADEFDAAVAPEAGSDAVEAALTPKAEAPQAPAAAETASFQLADSQASETQSLPTEPTPAVASAVTETIPPAKPQVAPESVYYVQDTTPLPDPIPEPQPTSPFPAADNPYAAAQAIPPAPAEQQPAFAAGYQPSAQQPGYQQQADFSVPPAPQPPAGAYQAAVQHQSFAPDPQVNPYEQNLVQLSGGMKFGWLVIGLLMGIPGMLIAWLVNADRHPQVKKDAIMWSVIGFAVNIVLGIILTIALTGVIASAIAGFGGSGYYGGGMYF